MGYHYSTPEEALKERNKKLRLLFCAKAQKITMINHKGNRYHFSEGNINFAIQVLKDLPLHEGYMTAAKYVYDTLTSGKTFEQIITAYD